MVETKDGYTLGSSRVMQPKEDWEKMVRVSCESLRACLNSRANVDENMQDQMLVLMTLFNNSNKKMTQQSLLVNKQTMHTLTALTLINQMLAQEHQGITFEANNHSQKDSLTQICCRSQGIP